MHSVRIARSDPYRCFALAPPLAGVGMPMVFLPEWSLNYSRAGWTILRTRQRTSRSRVDLTIPLNSRRWPSTTGAAPTG